MNPERQAMAHLVRKLYAARVNGDVESLCALFHAQAKLRIAGSSDGNHPIAILARGAGDIGSWLAVMVKTFRLAHFEELSMLIDGERAAVHWRADIHSRITGTVVSTELVDLLEVSAGKIVSYVEFFVPR
jgi:ketosteroid isomerase-like protein